MAVFRYEFKHDNGAGNGSVEANGSKDAEKQVINMLKSTETDDDKIENLEVAVLELKPVKK